jgi:hypothetical protein
MVPMVRLRITIRQVRLQRGEVVTPPAVHADVQDGECQLALVGRRLQSQ